MFQPLASGKDDFGPLLTTNIWNHFAPCAPPPRIDPILTSPLLRSNHFAIQERQFWANIVNFENYIDLKTVQVEAIWKAIKDCHAFIKISSFVLNLNPLNEMKLKFYLALNLDLSEKIAIGVAQCRNAFKPGLYSILFWNLCKKVPMVVAANKSDLGHGDAATKVEKQCYRFLFLVYLMYSLVLNVLTHIKYRLWERRWLQKYESLGSSSIRWKSWPFWKCTRKVPKDFSIKGKVQLLKNVPSPPYSFMASGMQCKSQLEHWDCFPGACQVDTLVF